VALTIQHHRLSFNNRTLILAQAKKPIAILLYFFLSTQNPSCPGHTLFFHQNHVCIFTIHHKAYQLFGKKMQEGC